MQLKVRLLNHKNKRNDTINHIVREYPKIAQREYQKRHDQIERRSYCDICKANGVCVKSKWYEHQPEAIIQNKPCKILWDFTVQKDHFLTARRPNMIFIDEKHHKCQIIDFAIPYDTRVDDKEVEKIKKYLDPVRELWNIKVGVVLLLVGALGTPAKTLGKRLKTIGIDTKVTKLQRAVLIHTSRFFQKVIEV